MLSKSNLLLFLSLFLFLIKVHADLPVHCEFAQVRGRWRFEYSNEILTRDNVFATCGYSSYFTTFNTREVTLGSPNVAIDDRTGERGNWTILQDQGIEVRIHGKKYIAFFNYTMQGETAVTNCSRTLTGWTRNITSFTTKPMWACFRAEKLASVSAENPAVPQTFTMQLPKPKSLIFKNDAKLVAKINAKQKSWVATTYDFLEGKPLSELLQSTSTLKPSRSAAAAPPSSSFNAKSKDYPTSLDWRNVDGINYVAPVRDQKSCGSCFSFAGTAMIESRLRIATRGKFEAVLPPQEVVSCSKMSQGCSGGDAFLVAAFAQDFGIGWNESCMPYTANNTECTTKCWDPSNRVYVQDYSYVGGYYGNTNHDTMMEAIVNGGPVTIGYYVYRDFMQYKSGVYHHQVFEDENEENMNGPDPVYYPTSHAVLVVGYGVTEAGEKYWICKNSWSEKWGMQGYFWIRRGTNESNCETKAVEATVIVPHM